mmetsp:Transcript_22972/g.64195  ORF Transcript_22972/g.64195 Transcript_22972/m.64195 type:complete len:277 (-) Transcript_22972:10-840(-)
MTEEGAAELALAPAPSGVGPVSTAGAGADTSNVVSNARGAATAAACAAAAAARAAAAAGAADAALGGVASAMEAEAGADEAPLGGEGPEVEAASGASVPSTVAAPMMVGSAPVCVATALEAPPAARAEAKWPRRRGNPGGNTCARHTGHAALRRNQSSMQGWWKRWLHGRRRPSCPTSNSAKQTLQVLSLSSSPICALLVAGQCCSMASTSMPWSVCRAARIRSAAATSRAMGGWLRSWSCPIMYLRHRNLAKKMAITRGTKRRAAPNQRSHEPMP